MSSEPDQQQMSENSPAAGPVVPLEVSEPKPDKPETETLAFLIALDPNNKQAQQFRSHCGGQRYAYNMMLGLINDNDATRARERAAGVPTDKLTPKLSRSAYSIRNLWNKEKQDAAPWYTENSKEVYEAGCFHLADALKRHDKGTSKKPKKKTRKSGMSCKFSHGVKLIDLRHVQLPRIGVIRTHESLQRVRNALDGEGTLQSATLSFKRGRWHLSLSVRIPRRERPRRKTQRVVGVDLGIKQLATLSTGEQVVNPKTLARYSKLLKRRQRQLARKEGPDKSTDTAPSNRWKRANARVNKIHTKVANTRRDYLHKFTTELIKRADVIVIEDLFVRGMLKNKRLARHISDAAWGEIRRQIEYKAERAGVEVVLANRFYPSSKTCSGCKSVKTKLALSERIYHCENCGLKLDRDHNAALNLAALAASKSGGAHAAPVVGGLRRDKLLLNQSNGVVSCDDTTTIKQYRSGSGPRRIDPIGSSTGARRSKKKQKTSATGCSPTTAVSP